MAIDTNQPFLWGSGGRRLTPEEILLERKEANALGQQAMATTPVGHWSAGLNRVLQGLLSGYDQNVASQAADRNAAESSAVIQALMGQAGGAPVAPITAPTAAPSVSTPMGNTSIPVSGDDNAARAMAFFQSKGMAPADAAAMVWNFQQESGKNLNPTLSHDGGTGFGIAGFRDPTPGQGRWTNLRNFAAENKLDPNSLDAQLQFAWNELQGPENATFQKIQAARTPEEKAAAAIGYFRPRADYAAARAARAGEVNSLLHGQPVQVASNDPTFAPAAPQIVDANQPSPLDTAQYPAGPVGAPAAAADGSDPAALPTNAQPAQGVLPTAQAVQAATQPARPAINPAILQAMTNPYVNDQTRQIATLLFKQQMDQQAKANDPMRQLQMQKLQADISAGKSPESVREFEYARTNGFGGSFQDWIASKRAGAGEYSLTPVYGKDAQGNTVLIQPGKSGTAVQTKLPEGVTISSGVDKIDLGTQWGIIDKRTGQIVGYQPKDLKGAESEKALGKAQGGVKATLPSDIQNAESTIAQIDQLSMHPGLSSIVGPLDQFRPNWTMGAEGRDALARYNQLKGKAFLQAYSTLRGGGQITEVEGVKAENAMARMDRAQSEDEFKLALKDFRDAVQIGMQKLREKAGVAAPSTQASSGKTSSGISWSVE